LTRPVTAKDYSYHYTLNNEEYDKFIELLGRDNLDDNYRAFIIVLLTSLNGNLNELTKILNVGSEILPPLLYSTVLRLIKEAIIIIGIENNKGLTVSQLSRLNRFKLADIDRNTINRTIKKYSINKTYTK